MKRDASKKAGSLPSRHRASYEVKEAAISLGIQVSKAPHLLRSVEGGAGGAGEEKSGGHGGGAGVGGRCAGQVSGLVGEGQGGGGSAEEEHEGGGAAGSEGDGGSGGAAVLTRCTARSVWSSLNQEPPSSFIRVRYIWLFKIGFYRHL